MKNAGRQEPSGVRLYRDSLPYFLGASADFASAGLASPDFAGTAATGVGAGATTGAVNAAGAGVAATGTTAIAAGMAAFCSNFTGSNVLGA